MASPLKASVHPNNSVRLRKTLAAGWTFSTNSSSGCEGAESVRVSTTIWARRRAESGSRWRPAGSKLPVGKGLRRIQRQQVHVACERQMLEAVVENVRVHLKALFRSLPAAKAVGAYDEGNFRKRARQKRRLVADFLRVRRGGLPRAPGRSSLPCCCGRTLA